MPTGRLYFDGRNRSASRNQEHPNHGRAFLPGGESRPRSNGQARGGHRVRTALSAILANCFSTGRLNPRSPDVKAPMQHVPAGRTPAKKPGVLSAETDKKLVNKLP